MTAGRIAVAIIGIVCFSDRALADTDWTEWTIAPKPQFEGQFIASDPAIIVVDDVYWMYYTCFTNDGSDQYEDEDFRASICAATSPDGLIWTNVDSMFGMFEGVVLHGRENEWDVNLEAAFALRSGDETLLYYSGYEQEGDPAKGYPAALAVARSSDGITFARVGDDPVLEPTPGSWDNDAVYSPTIVETDSGYSMVYAGHCYTNCNNPPGVTLLGATSVNGVVWEKLPEPILTADQAGLDWTRDGVAEPGLVESPDGDYYLFFTGLIDDERSIGIARSRSVTGPWTVNPDPIIVAGGGDESVVLAPMILIEGDTARMWYLGVNDSEEDFWIRYAEATLPLAS